MGVEIPDKLYFKIGEVAELTGVKPHVLRYWESEFAPIRPAKSRSKQRLYRRKDIELVLRLKDLLYNQGFTIAGARKKLREPGADSDQLALPLAVTPERKLLEEVRRDLRRLRKSLDPLR
jgi:DNA-binding transcriptional MerR regulator